MSDNLPATASTPFSLYRWGRGGMVRDDARGDFARLNDARWALQGLQSELESLRAQSDVGPADRAKQALHRHNGDMIRIWQIIGDPNQNGMRQDIFQRLQKIMEELALLREFYRRRNEAEGAVREADMLPAPPPRLAGG